MGKGRAPCCEKVGLKKGSWTPAEDMRLMAYIRKYGHGNWRALPKQAGLLRCGKSCRLRWINYLKPDIKRGNFTKEEEYSIIELHQRLGNKWSKIASHLPGRTDNEIKNVWNTHLKKRLGAQDKPSEEHIQPPTSPSTSSQFNPQNRNSTSPSEEPQQQTISSKPDTPSNTTNGNDINEIATFPSLDMWDILDSSSSPNPNTKHVPSDKNMIGDQKDTSCSSSSPNSSITHYTTLDQTQPHHSINNTNIGVDLDDVWDMLDDSSNVGLSTTTKGDNSWIEYLERELDLWSTSNNEEPHMVQPPQISNWCDHGGAMDATIDPITSYFDHTPPTPSSIHF